MADPKYEGLPGAPGAGVIEGHEYVDLGLGVLWATCNVGAASPYDAGQYFAWGETEPKDGYTPENYKAEGKNRLEPADDPAHVHWGGSWRMPTRPELKDLIDQCEWHFRRAKDDRAYFLITSKSNGNSLILPLAGHWNATVPRVESEKGHLWLNADLDKGASDAPCLSSEYCHAWECEINTCSHFSRYLGVPVRPVAPAPKPASKSRQDRILEESMPKLVRLTLDKWDAEASQLLGYRMVFQRKSNHSLEDEIRLVDGSVFTQSAEGEFEHAFLQLCMPMVHYNYQTVQLSSCESHCYVDGIDRTRYWTSNLADVTGGEEEARRCLDWLREWVDVHRDAARILDPDIVADDLRREGRRAPIKMHICYTDVPDPDWHGQCTIHSARGHQDIVAWYDEEALERKKTDCLLAGSICGYDAPVKIAAKMQMDETLGIDCEWLKIDIRWADGEFERLTEGIRLLTKKDVARLRRRLKAHGTGITPEILYKGLDHVYVRHRRWHRVDPFPPEHFEEDHLLPGYFSSMNEEWEAYDKAILLSDFSVEEIAERLKKKTAK